MGLRLITPPVLEPLTLSEVKANLHIDHADDDAVLTEALADARQWVEDRVQRKLMPQTWEFVIDYFPEHEIKLPLRPVLSITSIKYDDADGSEQTIPDTDYYLDDASDDAWLFPNADAAWPTDLIDAVNAVRIRFVAGYASAGLVPGSIKRAIHLKIRELYDETDTAQAVNNLLTNQIRLEA
jgi:uncharacterized phiE125 gp8 family phage protein